MKEENNGNGGPLSQQNKDATSSHAVTMSTGSSVNISNNPSIVSVTITENSNSNTNGATTTSQTASSPPPPAAAAAAAVSSNAGENHSQSPHAGVSHEVQEGEEEDDWRTVLEDNIAKPGREALHHFFYPPVRHRTAEEQQPQQLHHLQLSRDAVPGSITAVAATSAGTSDDFAHNDALGSKSSRNHNDGGGGTKTTTSPSRPRRRRLRPLTDDADGSVAPNSTNTTGVDQHNDIKDPLETVNVTSSRNSSSEQFQGEPNSQPQSTSLSLSQNHNNNSNNNNATTTSELFDEHFYQQALEDRKFVEHIWTIYDDIIILSLFTQVGIVARLGVSTWFSYFDNGVFSNNSPLFVNLPLNCLSCFIMGMLCSGERLMEIITTRFSPPQLQQQIQYDESLQNNDEDNNNSDDDDNDEEEMAGRHRKGRLRLPIHDRDGATSSDDDDGRSAAGHSSDDGGDGLYTTAAASPESATSGGSLFSSNGRLRRRRQSRRGGRLRRRQKRDKSASTWFRSWQPPVHVNDDLRDVQLLALERRIRLSKCLLLFPVKKEDVDVMEHYFQQGYKKEHGHHQHNQLNHSPGEDREEEEDEEYATEQSHQHDYSMKRWRGDRGTGRLDDLVLEERVVVQHVASKPKSTPNSLGENGPSAPTTTNDGNPAFVSPAKETESKPAVHPLTGTLSSSIKTIDHNERVHDMTTVELNQSSSKENGHQQPGIAPTSPHDATVNTNATLYGDKPGQDLNQMVNDVQANVTENISRLRRVNIADGWDVGTTPEAMSDDLMLGLRDGFCGALSSFSSWNSAMVNLLRGGQVGAALVGYILGVQLPIVSYRFGQHVAVYIFIWRCRRETKRDERRGYGIRVSMNEFSEEREMYHTSNSVHGSVEMVDTNDVDDAAGTNSPSSNQTSPQHSMGGGAGGAYTMPAETNHVERETPSIRAVATALFIIALVTQCTSISFYTDYDSQVIALSLLFSPLGVFARWRLSKYNSWRLTFPIGTFTANMLACALSGGLGRLLAGNPGEAERLVLVSFINGFGGTLSSVASFIVEILAGTDPVLLRLDGVVYALWSLFGATVIGFVFSASADWADTTE